MALGDQIDFPENTKIVSVGSGTLSPQWRDVIEEMITLINELSTEVKELKEQVNNGG